MNDTNDFNNELMKMLQEACEDKNQNEETCLISGEKLEQNCIQLECNHKFNYKFIYNEVHKQKTQPWHSEINKVKTFQLKCPYCRNIQTGILPFRENYPKVKYVNWPPSLMMLPDNCSYIFSSGKRKGLACGKKCNGKYCTSHNRIIEKREKKKLEKEKKKLEKEMKKKLEKEKKKLEKEMKKKLENEKNKKITKGGLAVVNWKKIEQKFHDNSIVPHAANADELTNVQIEQIMNVTTPISIPIVVTCSYIFKKGKRKGQNCQCKKIHKDGLCKFHYKKYKQAMEKKKTKLENINQNIKIKTVNYNQNGNIIITI